MGRPTEIKISGIPLFSPGAGAATRPERELFESAPNGAPSANGSPVEPNSREPECDSHPEADLKWDGDPVVVVPEPLAPTAPARAKSSRPRASRKDATSQVYLIEYRGEFLGTYQPRRRTTARTAYKSVAEQLWQRDRDGFDADRLELYKATPIPVDREAWSDDLAGGQFSWFAGPGGAEATSESDDR